MHPAHTPCAAPRIRLAPRRHATVVLLLPVLLPSLLLAGCGDRAMPTASTPGGASLSSVASVTKVVISQVYGGGGNTGAPYTNDFVELFNAGTTTVTLSGWSVQYASATGTGSFSANPVTALSGTLAPGQYYLVREGGGATGTALPTADATGTINMSATGGKVILANTTTGLACNGGSAPCSATQLAQIVDLVGYDGANFFEGAAAPTLSNTLAALRKNGGCTDTGNNANDFTAGAPSPRNTASTPNSCFGDAAPAVSSTTPASGAPDVARDASISITFSEPVTVTGDWFSISCTTSGAHAATASGGPVTFTLDPSTEFALGETCTVTVAAGAVSDQDTDDPPDAMAEDKRWSFTVTAVNVCEAAFTPIPTIQGSGASTTITGVVTTMGVVVGDYEGASPTLRGFYLQAATGDGDPATSDGIFVFNGNNDNVSVGDVVRVTGTPQEFEDQTQLGNVSAIVRCGAGSVDPTDVTLPVASATFLERYEGMLVRLPQTLYVTEHFQLGRFGQVVLSSGGRLPQPTNVALPGAPALAVQAQNALNRIIIDDALNVQNPDPILFGRGGSPLGAGNTLRGGDAATGIVGVLTYTWAGNAASGNAYRVRPVNALGGAIPAFAPANPRPAAPAAVGGSLKVASLNLLNFFNTFSGCTNGVGGALTDCRGAENALEFERQAAKAVAAVVGTDADVVGVIEVENDGYGPSSAIADLVNRLNGATAAGTYAFVDVDAGTGQVNALGTDAIRVGLIYRPASVTPVGTTAALNSAAFVNGGDGEPRNRAALAQAFAQNATGARFVVSVNHLKSKGSACDAPDAGDGQGNCNAVRVNAATELRKWLATDPTGTGDPDVLIVGDLNSYAKEDPVTTLTTGGYTDLIASHVGSSAYSYLFDGQFGYLDHALANATLSSQVTGVTEWHINADEPAVLDYNTNFKSPNQVGSLYAPDAFRAADHDPLIVGLSLTTPYPFGGFVAPVDNPPTVNMTKAGSAIPVKFSLGGNRGLAIFLAGSPRSDAIACDDLAPTDVVSETVAAGGSGLTYDAATDQYTYVWKTDRAWANSCRKLIVRFTDNSGYAAVFKFTK